jgi:hypothetical protein
MSSAVLPAPWLGASEMAQMVRDFDWSTTPLGALEAWSPVLRTSLAMCLHSRFPMVVYWGRELIFLYNDANRDAIGQLHPGAFGRPAREVLPESWHVLEPRLLAVLERGEASWAVDEKLAFSFREQPEAGYFTYSFSPIHDVDGRVGGVLLVTQDTTERVIAERRIALLRKLAAVDDLDTVDAACGALVAALEDSPDLPLACIYLLEGSGDRSCRRGGRAGARSRRARAPRGSRPRPPSRVEPRGRREAASAPRRAAGRGEGPPRPCPRRRASGSWTAARAALPSSAPAPRRARPRRGCRTRRGARAGRRAGSSSPSRGSQPARTRRRRSVVSATARWASPASSSTRKPRP